MKLDWELVRAVINKCCRFILQKYAVNVNGSIKTADMNPGAQS